MSDASAPAGDAARPSPPAPYTPASRARGVAMTAGLVMTPLMIAAGFWVERTELMSVLAGAPQGVVAAELRSTIAPESTQR